MQLSWEFKEKDNALYFWNCETKPVAWFVIKENLFHEQARSSAIKIFESPPLLTCLLTLEELLISVWNQETKQSLMFCEIDLIYVRNFFIYTNPGSNCLWWAELHCCYSTCVAQKTMWVGLGSRNFLHWTPNHAKKKQKKIELGRKSKKIELGPWVLGRIR